VPYVGATQTLALGTNNGITLTDTGSNSSIAINSSSVGGGAILIDKFTNGSGITVNNNGIGYGIISNNESTGRGISIGNASTGKGLVIDNAADATGDPFVYTLGGGAFVKAKIDYLGNITGNSFIVTGSTIPTNGMYLSAANTLNLATNSTNKFSISSVGVVTISALGSGTVTSTSGVLSAVSDMNLKVADGFISNALEKVLNLKPRYFYWNEESGLPTDNRQLGFYAQEVNEALGEEAANTPKTENESWGIYDRGIVAMLTKAIQEQQAQIEELKAKLK
jgi:hypothetical protein